MKAYWYTDNPNSLYGNVVDMLTPIIIQHFTGKKPEYAKADENGKLLAVGSVCEFIQPNDTVWGSGFIGQDQAAIHANKKQRNVKILAVRGKLTAEALRKIGYDVPEVYGDPAVLMPEVYDPNAKFTITRPYNTIPIRYDIGYVPHYIEKDAWQQHFGISKYYISIINTPYQFIDSMMQCHKIVTSSLHAYILAQAYGLQAEYVQLTSKIIGGYFKYADYISGRGDPETLKKVFIEWCKGVGN